MTVKNSAIAIGLLGLVCVGAATAQTTRVIEEVIITAQKTEQSIQDVPISVTAIDGEFIKEAGIGDLKELSVYVPNVRIDANDPGSPQIFVRGFGTNTFNPSFESSVGFVQDDVFFGRAGYFTEAMFDVGRIEVLRGPQGTLFGKNTISGVFNVSSRPVTPEWSADLEARGGEHGERRLEGGVGGMLTDWFGLRVSALDAEKDGQLRNTFLDSDAEAFEQDAQRLKLLLVPSDALEMELFGVRSDTDTAYWPKQLKNLDADTRSYLQGFDPEVDDDPFDFRTSMDVDGSLQKGSDTVGGKMTYGFGEIGALYNLDMVIVAADSKFHIDQYQDLDVSPADIARLFNAERYHQQTLEWRFAGDAPSLFGLGSSLQFVAGAYLFRSDYKLRAGVAGGEDVGSYLGTTDAQQLAGDQAPLLPLLQLAAATTTNDKYSFAYDQDTEALALFGQFTLNLGDHWAITPGVRINRETKTVDTAGRGSCESTTASPPPVCVMPLLLGANDYAYEGLEREKTDISPKLSVMYYINDDLNVFVTYTKGFKSGGYNSISFTGQDLEFEDEEARTLELGTKGKFLDNTLSVNATVYRTEFDNLQVLAFNGVFFDVSNAASAVSQGLELDFQWLTPYEPLAIIGSAGLLDATYENYSSAPAPVQQGINTRQDLSGERIAFAPENSLMLSPTLSYSLFDAVMLNLSVDLIHQGEQFTDTDLDPNVKVPANTTYAARVALRDLGERWSVTLGVKNLTDKLTQNQVVDAVFFPGSYYAQQNPGRQVYGSLRLTW